MTHPECPCCGYDTHAHVACGLGCHRPECYEFSCRDMLTQFTSLSDYTHPKSDEPAIEQALELAEQIDRQDPGAMSDEELAAAVLYELDETAQYL